MKLAFQKEINRLVIPWIVMLFKVTEPGEYSPQVFEPTPPVALKFDTRILLPPSETCPALHPDTDMP